ncbi:MAG TPA: hypothetical protein VMN03_00265 [Burkholderiales bacterium]|nr:hypothetical protein [Burkholderiales bacterium]
MRRTLAVWLVVLVCGAALAQELRITRLRTLPAGKSPDGKDMVTLTTDAGETVSKNGVVVPYELFLAGEKPGGLRFERAPLMSLKAGDQIRMYVTGLEPEPFGGDPTSEAGGVWKLVTIAGLKESGGRVHFEFQEKLKRKDGSFTQEVVLTAQDKYLVSASAESAAGAPPAAAAPGRAWSLSDVPLWGWIAVLAVALGGVLVILLRRKPPPKTTSSGS